MNERRWEKCVMEVRVNALSVRIKKGKFVVLGIGFVLSCYAVND